MKKFNNPIAYTFDEKLVAVSIKTKKKVYFKNLEELDRFARTFRKIFGQDALSMH